MYEYNFRINQMDTSQAIFILFKLDTTVNFNNYIIISYNKKNIYIKFMFDYK